MATAVIAGAERARPRPGSAGAGRLAAYAAWWNDADSRFRLQDRIELRHARADERLWIVVLRER